MVLCVFFSLLFLGVRPWFCLGLVAGTAVSILNVLLAALFKGIAARKENRFIPAFGLVFRVLVYAAALWILLILVGYEGSIGAVIGFVTVYVAIFYINAVEIKIVKRKKRQQEAGIVLNPPLSGNSNELDK